MIIILKPGTHETLTGEKIYVPVTIIAETPKKEGK